MHGTLGMSGYIRGGRSQVKLPFDFLYIPFYSFAF